MRPRTRIAEPLHPRLHDGHFVGETGAVRFHPVSANRKLAPVDLVDVGGERPRPTPRGPFCSSTYVSIGATCPDSCAFKRAGCMVDAGFTRQASVQMDAAAEGRSGLQVAREEALAVIGAFGGKAVPQDGARGGRDLRLHVGGDVGGGEAGARLLGAAAREWRRRRGGSPWTFTHHWRGVPRAAWGPSIAVLASVEHPDDVALARAQGYAPAVTVPEFPAGRRPFRFGDAKIVPCPAETRETTCVECRLCLDHESDLLRTGAGIGFAVHGAQAAVARATLVRIGRRR